MNGIGSFLWIGALLVASLLLLRRLGLVSAATARKHFLAGAVVVDVRSPEEFQAGHLPGTLNLPLSDLPDAALRRWPDRQQVLLLHCLSGSRSGVARRLLNGAGYTRVFNLGSYRRARSLLRKPQAV
jgi:phage shock protein E